MNIYDIAQRSGVSIATVSRVLNGSKNVSQKTRAKVLSVMQQEEYTPNAFARGLGLNTMKMIGILCTDISDTYYAKAVSLVENQLRQKGFDALLCCTGNNLEDKKKYLDLLLAKRVDAVILIGSAFKENVDNSHIEAAAKQVPVIIINGLVEMPGAYCVICDEKSAVSQNVCMLHEHGFDNILYLYDSLTYSGCQKIEGYKTGLQLCSLPIQESLLVRVEKSVDSAADKVMELLETNRHFNAVVTSEDLLAIGALKALHKKQLRMPVIGFNNSILSECSSPALTSVDNMLDTLCPTAVNMLTDIFEGKNVTSRIVITSKFIERESFQLKPNNDK